MLTLRYTCGERACSFESTSLDDAQKHANEERHAINIIGALTPNRPPPTQSIDEVARTKARTNEILRRAKERGLVR